MKKRINRALWRVGLVALLLVLVAAISVGILAPALHRARRARRSMLCMSNLKMLSLAMIMYENDYDHFPLSSIKMLDPFTNQEAEFGWPTILVRGGYIDLAYAHKTKSMNIPEGDPFVCPEHGKAAAKFSRGGIYCSYAMNREILPKYKWANPEDKIESGPLTFLLTDSDFMEISDNWHIKFNRQCAFDFRHRLGSIKPPGANFAFCDGHIEYRRVKWPATPHHAPFLLDYQGGHFWGGSVLERVRKRAGAKVKEATPSGLLPDEEKEWLWYICQKSGHKWKIAKDDRYFVKHLSGKEPNTPVTCPRDHKDAYPAAVCPECGHIYLDLDDSNICPNCGPFEQN